MIIWRHTETEYRQGIVSLSSANDITDAGRIILEQNVEKVKPYIKNPKIVSSPYGRTLESAKVINLYLDTDIIVDDRIQEVKFDFELFLAFVNGGEANGYNIDKNVTNPSDYTVEEYFHREAMHNLPIRSMSMLSGEIRREMSGFERCHAACNRLEKAVMDYPDDTIFMTHEGLTWNYIQRAGQGYEGFLERGHFITVDDGPIYMSQRHK